MTWSPAHTEALRVPRSSALGVHVREVFARARDPRDVDELSALYIGAVEAELGDRCLRPEAATRWRAARRRREVSDEEILSLRTTVRWVKELFNHYFRDDLYGALRRDDTLILSSGSLDEELFGLPDTLKQLVVTALQRDWYGYSDSRGRRPSRQAVAALENVTLTGAPYDADWVALTMGGTFAIACLADFLLAGGGASSDALCAIPNYPPLVEAVARRTKTRLIPTTIVDGRTDISSLICALRRDTPLVLLQTVTNPTGTPVAEGQIAQLVRAAAPSTIILLDEAHECLSGAAPERRCAERAWPNVVRVTSLSKTFAIPGMKLGWILCHPDVMRQYYEYASTTYGGPPSLFYLFVEMAARFARWEALGLDRPDERFLGEIETEYGYGMATLAAEYAAFVTHRRDAQRRVTEARERAVTALEDAGCRPIRPRHSINVAIRPSGCANSYTWFRKCLAAQGVSCFPGILTFGLEDDSARITVGRSIDELDRGLARIRAFVEAGP